MRKIFTILLISITSVAWAQKYKLSNKNQIDSNEDRRVYFKGHEIKLNPFALILGTLNASYEKTLSQESSFGGTIGFGFAENPNISAYAKDYKYDVKVKTDFHLAPYYRYYFGQYINTGFFLEGFMVYNYNRVLQYSSIHDKFYDKKYTYANFAMGVGLGWKIVTMKGVSFELNFGLGRAIIEYEDKELSINGITIEPPIVIKGGLSVGYRF